MRNCIYYIALSVLIMSVVRSDVAFASVGTQDFPATVNAKFDLLGFDTSSLRGADGLSTFDPLSFPSSVVLNKVDDGSGNFIYTGAVQDMGSNFYGNVTLVSPLEDFFPASGVFVTGDLAILQFDLQDNFATDVYREYRVAVGDDGSLSLDPSDTTGGAGFVATTLSVPEPGSLAIPCGAGGAALLARGGRRRRAA